MTELATIAGPPAVSDEVAVIAAVAALPLPIDDAHQEHNLRSETAAWLASRKSRHTRRAYFADLADYLSWCDQTGRDPRRVKRSDIDRYTVVRTKALSEVSKARRLSTLSSWYAYLISNDVTDRNPVLSVDRPNIDRDASPTVGLTGEQIGRFMRAARAATGRTARRDAALLAMMAELGLRVSEATALDIAKDFGEHRGHRIVWATGKGGKRRRLPIPVPLARDLDAYLEERAQGAGVAVADLVGPVFVTSTGRPLDQGSVYRLVQRIARAAGLKNADKLSPHSLRHTVATAALDEGAPLRDVQDMLGHADPRTTRRYDRDRDSLDRSPAYAIAKLFAHDGGSDNRG